MGMMHKYKIKRWLTVGMSAIFAIGLSGCSDDSGTGTSTSTATTPSSGVLIDGPVSGVSYHSPSHSGKTSDFDPSEPESGGKFNYTDGEDVTFDFGSVKFGGSRGKGVITPMDLMNSESDDDRVKMMASLLQSLDQDGSHGNGIQLNDAIAKLLKDKLADGGDYSSILTAGGVIDFTALTAPDLTLAKATLETVLTGVVELAAADGDDATDLKYVDLDKAAANLLAATEESVIFRKNISKTPALPSSKSKLNIMTMYVPAAKADGTVLGMVDGQCEAGQQIVGKGDGCWAKPVTIAYTDVDKRTPAAAPDAFLAISADDGASWKRFNLSRTGDKPVAISGLPEGALGESKKPVFQAKGDKVIVAWTDKYCKGGQPRYAALAVDAEGAPVDLDGDGTSDKLYSDYYGVAGSQGFIDYSTLTPEVDADRLPSPPQVAYSCLWTARATVTPWTGEVQVYKSERMTSGVRDSYQVFVGGAGGAGFAITWQEDPGGIRPGSGDGPGHGFSGATTNHKTDAWYSYIKWADFSAIDTSDEPVATDPDLANDDSDLVGDPVDDIAENARVRVLNHMSMPVRLSDNNMCNISNIGTSGHEYCRLGEDGTLVEWTGWDTAETAATPTPEAYSQMVNCASMQTVTTSSGDQLVCVTRAGSILDGDTGASRPNLFLQPYTKKDGTVSAWAILAYEETKGLGVGPDAVEEDIVELGKDLFYHSFDIAEPNLITSGDLVNMPELEDIDGTPGAPVILAMADGTVRYATENARRIRFILQGKKPSLGPNGNDGAGVPLIAIYKQGKEGKGRPSDIMLRRTSVWTNPDCEPGTCVAKTGNPYAFKNFLCDTWLPATTATVEVKAADGTTTTTVTGELPQTCNARGAKGVQNMSTVTPIVKLAPGSEDEVVDGDDKIVYDKLMTWTVTEADLLKESFETPMTESRAHRGQIRGDWVTLGYVFSPNWAASRNGKDKYDFYARRSFDGGVTWTTMPAAIGGQGVTSCYWDRGAVLGEEATIKCDTFAAGAFEKPRNLSLLKNATQSVIEPRVVAVPGTILACGGVQCVGVTNPNEDKQNKKFYISSYGMAGNVNPDDAAPTDMFYARTSDFGETYSTGPHNEWVDDQGQPLQVFNWLAARKNVEEGEAQLRMTPDGSKGYSSYLGESNEDYDDTAHFEGSDIWFRKMSEADFNPVEETEE